jgi:hypothetical protein
MLFFGDFSPRSFSHLEGIKHVLRFLSNHLSAFFWKVLNLMSEIFQLDHCVMSILWFGRHLSEHQEKCCAQKNGESLCQSSGVSRTDGWTFVMWRTLQSWPVRDWCNCQRYPVLVTHSLALCLFFYLKVIEETCQSMHGHW